MITDSMRAHADLLLSRSHLWTRATRKSDGLAFVIFPSSRSNTAYYTRCDGGACTCKGYLWRGVCSHALACQIDAERAREAAGRKPRPRLDQLMDAWLDEGTQTVAAF